jgi:hypothetical protein
MPRRCTVCDHPERHGIDEALVTGAPYRSVAKQFGLSESAVYRYKTEHLPAHLLKAREVEEVAQADDLLEQVRHLQAHPLDILERAEKAGDLRTALAAISQVRGNLELLGKLAGELDERPVVNLNVSSEWLELRAVIVGALEPHPAAHRAVLRALEGVGNGCLAEDLKLTLDRVAFAQSVRIVPDRWQFDLLRTGSNRVLFKITRQGGKCSMAAIIALHPALYHPQSLILCLAPALCQSQELFTKIATLYRELGRPVAPLAGGGGDTYWLNAQA